MVVPEQACRSSNVFCQLKYGHCELGWVKAGFFGHLAWPFLTFTSAHLSLTTSLFPGSFCSLVPVHPTPSIFAVHRLCLVWIQCEHRRLLDSLADKQRGPGLPGPCFAPVPALVAGADQAPPSGPIPGTGAPATYHRLGPAPASVAQVSLLLVEGAE